MFVVYLLPASVDWMWQLTGVTVLALAGVSILSARLSRGPLRLRWPVRIACVVFALGAGALQLPGLVSTTEIRRSQQAARAGDATGALVWAQRAVSAEPWSASAYLQRGLVFESEGRLDQAVATCSAPSRTSAPITFTG